MGRMELKVNCQDHSVPKIMVNKSEASATVPHRVCLVLHEPNCQIGSVDQTQYPVPVSVLHAPSIRQYLSYGDCVEDEREDYQNYSVLYLTCNTVVYNHMHTEQFIQTKCFRFRFLSVFLCLH